MPGFRDHAGKESEMIILHQDNRQIRGFHLLDGGIGEAAIDFLISDPIFGTKDGTSVRDVAERPDAFVSEAFVVTLLFFGAEPDAAQSVTRMVWWNAKMVLGVDAFAVGATRAVGDPGAVGGQQHGLKSGDQAARGNHNLHTSIVGAVADRHIWLAVGDDQQRAFFAISTPTHTPKRSRPQR